MSKKGSEVREIVERYYATVCDPSATPEALTGLLDGEVRITEHPNALSPTGSVRGLADTMAGFESGKTLLASQEFELHEVIVVADRAAVRATWRGTIGEAAGPLPAGTELRAQVAAFLTIRDGKVLDQETFDCYHPLPAATGRTRPA